MARKTKGQDSRDTTTPSASFSPLDHALFASAADGILLVDPSGKIVQANPQVEKLFGYPQAELVGQPVELLLPQHQQKSHEKYRDRYFAHPEARPMGTSLDLRGLHKDGSEFSVDILLRTITLEDQTLAVAAIRDVTAQRLIERRLRQSEERFRNIFNHSNDAILVVDPVADKILLANQKSCDLLGYTHEEMLSLPCSVVHPQEMTHFREFIQSVTRKGYGWTDELSCTTKTGQCIPTEISASLYPQGDSPDSTQIIVHVRNILERNLAQEALQKSEQKFYKIFRSSPIPITLGRVSDGVLLDVNDHFCKVSGYQRSEVIGRTVHELKLMEDPGQRQQIIDQLQQGGSVRNLAVTLRAKNGALRSLLYSAEIVDVHEEACILASAQDITEQKQAEEASRQNEERFRAMAELSPSPIMITRQSDGQTVFANERAAQAFGGKLEDTRGSRAPDFYYDSADREKMLKRLAREGAIHNMELQLKRLDGTPFWVIGSIQPLRFEDDDFLLSVFTDISERKQMEGELRASEERFSKAFHASGDGISITTFPGGRFLDVNESFLQITGYAREEVIGHSALDLDLWRNTEEREQFMRGLEQHGNVRGIEVSAKTKSGEKRIALVSADRVTLGNQDCLLMVSKDITARKQAEEEVRHYAERLHQVIEFLPVAARVMQLGRVVFANATDARLFGYATPKDIIGTDAFAHIAEEDIPRLRDYSERRSAGNPDVPVRFEARGKRLDGAEFPIEISVRKIQWAGQPASLAVTEDLTQRKRLNLYESFLPVCSVCGKVRDDTGKERGQGDWNSLEQYVRERASMSHTFCPICLEEYRRSQGLRSDSHSSDD